MKWLFLSLLVASCATTGSMPKSEKYQMEMTLHKTRSDLEEVKHDLYTQKIELAILGSKMEGHEEQMLFLKRESFDIHQTKLEECLLQITQLEKKIATLEGKQTDLLDQLQKVSLLTQEMSKALMQSKEKLNELERAFTIPSKYLSDVTKLKRDVERLSLAIGQSSPRTE